MLIYSVNTLLSSGRGELDTRQRQSEIVKLEATLQSRLDALKGKRQRVIDAFLHERSIDRATNKEQLDLLNEDMAQPSFGVPKQRSARSSQSSHIELA